MEQTTGSGLAADVGERIIKERVNRYVREVTADRFDGTPNWDHAEGAEFALRTLAADYGYDVPTEDETQRRAKERLREEIRERSRIPGRPSCYDLAILEHLDATEAGTV